MVRRTVVALLGVALVAGAGCGDDDEASLDEFCEVAAELTANEAPTDADLDRYVAAAPDEIADEAELAAEAIKERGEAAFDDEDVLDAIEDLEAFEARECGIESGDPEDDVDVDIDIDDDADDDGADDDAPTTEATTDDTSLDDDTTTTTTVDSSVTTEP